jgi:putative transposase
VSDAHEGLKTAIARTLSGPWQRCTVRFLSDCLGHARRDQHGLLAAPIRPLFNQPNRDEASVRLREAIAQLERPLPKVARILERAEEEILAFYALPQEHWRKLRSTNPLERFNREICRRTDVVGIFPDDRSLIRLVSSWRSRPTASGSSPAATRAASRSSRCSSSGSSDHPKRRSPSSSRPEQPTPSPTS